ncbi:MAG: hypothetical protein PHR53_09670 [Bacteroidales bacterium]|nr:hypothetical protein [Bacteroidales bacterium]
MKTEKILRNTLIFWTLFIGIGAVVGSVAMIFLDPSGQDWGMAPILSLLQNRMPFADIFFTDFRWSGVALMSACGIPQLLTAVLLFLKHRWATMGGIISGIILILWIILEFFIWGFAGLSVAYFIFGVLEMLNGIVLYKREKCIK